jgi:uncharacterized membrane protein
MNSQTAITANRRTEKFIGALLRTGVILAALIVLTGGVLDLFRSSAPATNYRVFQGEPAELRSLTGIVHAAREFNGRALIQLGLVVLIATPIARVVFSLFVFLYERDWTYVLIILVVLGLLLYSLSGRW